MTLPVASLRVGPNIMSVIHNSLARAHSKALVGPPEGGGKCLIERASNCSAASNRYTEGRLKVPGWRVPCSTSRRTSTLILSCGYFLRNSMRAWHCSGLSALRLPLSLRG